jgi:hypothetical protein
MSLPTDTASVCRHTRTFFYVTPPITLVIAGSAAVAAISICHESGFQALERGYTRDRLPAYSFVVRARAVVLTGERTLSDTSGARQNCPRARQTAPDSYVYGLSGALKNR